MQLKVNSIVKHKDTKEVYEVILMIGSMVLCRPVNLPSLKDKEVPFRADELEVMMEEETDIFNVLFKDN